MEPESHLICELQRDPEHKVCLTSRQYKGKAYFDLRLWFLSKETPGFYPSKRGICLSVDLLPQVIAGLQQIENSDLVRTAKTAAKAE